jgi:hypothetical protein
VYVFEEAQFVGGLSHSDRPGMLARSERVG